MLSHIHMHMHIMSNGPDACHDAHTILFISLRTSSSLSGRLAIVFYVCLGSVDQEEGCPERWRRRYWAQSNEHADDLRDEGPPIRKWRRW